MAEPWYDPATFGAVFGGVVGGGGGTLVGLLGALAGTLAPRGIGRTWVLGGMWAFVLLGVASFGWGVYALVMGQPWFIWYAPMLAGLILGGVCGGLIPVVRLRYAEAERRRIEAESLRRS